MNTKLQQENNSKVIFEKVAERFDSSTSVIFHYKTMLIMRKIMQRLN